MPKKTLKTVGIFGSLEIVGTFGVSIGVGSRWEYTYSDFKTTVKINVLIKLLHFFSQHAAEVFFCILEWAFREEGERERRKNPLGSTTFIHARIYQHYDAAVYHVRICIQKLDELGWVLYDFIF